MTNWYELPAWDMELRCWEGGSTHTLYAFTDKRTGRVTVRPGTETPDGTHYFEGLRGIGPEVSVRVASRREAEAQWQFPLSPGWHVID